MTATQRCPYCNHENSLAAAVCVACRAGLAQPSMRTTTVQMADLPTPPPAEIGPDAPKNVTINGAEIVLDILDFPTPIIIEASVARILVGRSAPDELPPTVDLNAYGGQAAGVSRRHCVIHRSENGVFLQDLDSTNGTWLNDVKLVGQRLYEVNPGDSLRFAQLAARILFTPQIVGPAPASAPAAPPPEAPSLVHDTLILTDEAVGPVVLTTQYLEQRVLPYIEAAAALQAVINSATGRPAAPVTVKTIGCVDGGSLLIMLVNAPDAAALVDDHVGAWHRELLPIIEQLREYGGQARASGDETRQNQLRAASEPLRKALRQRLGALAIETVVRFAPDLAPERHKELMEKIQPALQTLALSPLQAPAPAEVASEASV